MIIKLLGNAVKELQLLSKKVRKVVKDENTYLIFKNTEEVVIGRTGVGIAVGEVDIGFKNAYVSGEHCSIKKNSIKDLNSKNGTVVEGKDDILHWRKDVKNDWIELEKGCKVTLANRITFKIVEI